MIAQQSHNNHITNRQWFFCECWTISYWLLLLHFFFLRLKRWHYLIFVSKNVKNEIFVCLNTLYVHKNINTTRCFLQIRCFILICIAFLRYVLTKIGKKSMIEEWHNNHATITKRSSSNHTEITQQSCIQNLQNNYMTIT